MFAQTSHRVLFLPLNLSIPKKLITQTLFWTHLGIILFALTMGLFFPLWIVLISALLHRLQTIIFDGCLFSKLERTMGSFDTSTDFLRHAGKKLFHVSLTSQGSKVVDYFFLVLSMSIAFGKYFVDFGLLSIVSYSVILFAIFGLGIAGFISYRDKLTERVCSSGTCEVVLESSLSKIGRWQLSQLGMLFYTCIILLTLMSTVLPQIFSIITLLGIAGFIVSIFLILAQATIVRAWCKWCISSAFSSTAIATLVVFAT